MRIGFRKGWWTIIPLILMSFSSIAKADNIVTSIPDAGFETNSFTGWSRGTQTGTLGATITSNGSGVSIFNGSRTFTHGPRNAMGSPTKSDGSPNPYYAPAVSAGSWTFSPKGGTYAALLQPKGEQTFNQAAAALGLSNTQVTQLKSTLTSQASASGFGGGNPTDAAWITREVELTAGTTYTMSWNYVGTDYVPYNDGSITTLTPVSVESTPTITVNNFVQSYALLGFTNPGTGDYSTNSFGATGWQMSTYEVSVTGTYKLGFASFNLDDKSLSPALMIDDDIGTTLLCNQSGGSCTTFGGVEPNNETAPTTPPTTTTSTTTTTTTSTTTTTTTTLPPAPTSLEVTSLDDDGSNGTLRWAITQANATSGGIYDSITFNINGTITLTSALPQITESLTIDGNGRTNTIIDGDNSFRIFYVTSGRTLTVSDMTLKQGQAANGGLIYNSQGTVIATNIRFTAMSGGTAVWNNNGGSTATYTNCTFDYLNVGISGDYGSTPQLPSGTTSWNAVDESGSAVAPDSLFGNKTYVDNCIFDNNNAGIDTQRFTKVEDSTFTNNSYAANIQGLNRSQILNSTFDGNQIGIYHNAWIPASFNMGTDNRLIDGNQFLNNGISIYLDDGYNDGHKDPRWATITDNIWDGEGIWVKYYLWNSDALDNQAGTIGIADSTELFVHANNVNGTPVTTTTTTTTTTTVPQEVVETTTTSTTTTTTEVVAPEPQPVPVVIPTTTSPEDTTPDTTVPDNTTPDTSTPEQEDLLPTETTIETPEETIPVSTEPEVTQEEEALPEDITPETTVPSEPEVPAEDISVDEVLENIEDVENIVNLLEESDLTEEEVQQVVEAILENGLDEEQAVTLATSAAVLESLTPEQATAVFESITPGVLTEEAKSEIIDAVQDAPQEVKEAFEEAIDIYKEGFDEYVPVGSEIPVKARRALLAASAVTATLTAAGPASGSPSGPSGNTRNNDNNVARKQEEEEASGEIAGPEDDDDEKFTRNSIFKYYIKEGIEMRRFNPLGFLSKLWDITAGLAFTLAGSVVVFITLSGQTRKVAIIATAIALLVHYIYTILKNDE